MTAMAEPDTRRAALVPQWVPFHLLFAAWSAALLVVWCVHRQAINRPIWPGTDDPELHEFATVGMLMSVLIHLGFRHVYLPLSNWLQCVSRPRESAFRIVVIGTLGILASLLVAVVLAAMRGQPPDAVPKALASKLFVAGFVTATIVEVVCELQLSRLRLADTTRELTRRATEARVAHDVQQQLLPATLPEVEGIEITARSLPADEVGGDFYDVVELSRRQIAFVLGDVSGHGMAAALLTTALQTQVRTRLGIVTDLRQLIAEVNEQLCKQTDGLRFATMFLGIYDADDRMLRFVNAGHNYPLLIRAEQGETIVRELKSTGLPVGIDPDAGHAVDKIHVDTGATLVIYSDGVTDAGAPIRDVFGEDRLETCLAGAGSRSVDENLEAIYRAVDEWNGGASRTDDQTMVVARFGPDCVPFSNELGGTSPGHGMDVRKVTPEDNS